MSGVPRSVWNFTQGLKFKTDLTQNLEAVDVNWGGGSNPRPTAIPTLVRYTSFKNTNKESYFINIMIIICLPVKHECIKHQQGNELWGRNTRLCSALMIALCRRHMLKTLVLETCTKNLMQVHHSVLHQNNSRCTWKNLYQKKTCTRLTDTRASFWYKLLIGLVDVIVTNQCTTGSASN